jgi:hypothetical protein
MKNDVGRTNPTMFPVLLKSALTVRKNYGGLMRIMPVVKKIKRHLAERQIGDQKTKKCSMDDFSFQCDLPQK